MTRPYHSPSSLSIRCDYAWALRYLANVREAEVPWSEFAGDPPRWKCPHPAEGPHRVGRNHTCVLCAKLRGASLGKAMHTTLEAWYTPLATPDWQWYPGQVASAGLAFLPHPEECLEIQTECPIGTVPTGAPEGSPQVAMFVHGVKFAGNRDLVVRAPEALARLGVVDIAGGWWLLDYKSSSDVKKWAKTPADLADDVQCNAYALDVMTVLGVDAIPCRWVYFETKAFRRAAPVDVVITRANATRMLGDAAAHARRVDSIVSLDHAEHNLDACSDYVVCQHHEAVGGMCRVRRTIGQMVMRSRRRQPKKEVTIMPINSETAAKFASKFAKPGTTTTAAPPAIEAPPAEAPPVEAPPAEAPPAAKRGRPPGAKKVPPAEAQPNEVTPPVAPDALTAIRLIVAERDAALARATELDAQLVALRNEISAAFGETGVAH